jgi:hypothetical protein
MPQGGERGGEHQQPGQRARGPRRAGSRQRETMKSATGTATARAPVVPPDLGVVRRAVDLDRYARAGRGGGEHQQVAVLLDERLAQVLPEVGRGAVEVEPPHRDHDQHPADDLREQVRGAGALRGRRLDRQRRGQDGLAEHDDGEQPVALDDVRFSARA